MRFNCQQLEDRVTPATVSIFDDIDTATNDSGSLRDAIDFVNASNSDNSIDFDASKFDNLATAIELLSSLPLITEEVAIIGFNNNDFVKINGNNQFQAFVSTAGVPVSISGLTIRNSPGGIDFTGGDLAISNLSLSGSTTNGDGGAIRYTGNGTLSIANCTFSNLSATGSGGAISIGNGNLSVVDSSFTNCHANGDGGAIHTVIMQNIFSINKSTFHGNSATSGGAISIDNSFASISLIDSTFTNNSASFNGGAVAAISDSVSVTVGALNSTFTDHTASQSGGAIHVTKGTLTVVSSDLKANSAGGNGGSLAVAVGDVNLKLASITDSTAAGNGGGIYAGKGTVSVDAVNLTGCTAGDSGGGIQIDSGKFIALVGASSTVRFQNCDALGLNQTDGGGGGINIVDGQLNVFVDSKGTFEIVDCDAKIFGGGLRVASAFDQRTSSLEGSLGTILIRDCDAGYGGGAAFDRQILTMTTATIRDCGLEGGTGFAGGVFVNDCDTEMRYVQILNNKANVDAGGLKASYTTAVGMKGSTLILRDSLISDCTATRYGGGLYVDSVEARIYKSTVTESSVTGFKYFAVPGDPNSAVLYEARGGGIFVVMGNTTGTINVDYSNVTACTSKVDGGGIGAGFKNDNYSEIFLFAGKIYLNNAQVTGNSADRDGGGISYREHAVASVNYAPLVPDVELFYATNQSTIMNNSAGQFGGGLHFATFGAGGRPIQHANSTYAQNTAKFAGGGIYFDSNAPEATASERIATFRSVTIANNQVFGDDEIAGAGGGIFIAKFGGDIDMSYCTITGNRAITAAGMGIFGSFVLITSAPPAAINYVTIDGTVIAENGFFGVNSNIVESNFSAVLDPVSEVNTHLGIVMNYSALDAGSFFSPDDPSLFYSTSFNNMLTTNAHSDLLLEPLAIDGGPTPTIKPGPESPLIDFVPFDYVPVLSDQRAYTRPNRDITGAFLKSDIGAYEVGTNENNTTNNQPNLTSVVVNDGSIQRSRVTSITLNFADPVDSELFRGFGDFILERTAATSTGVLGTLVSSGITQDQGVVYTNFPGAYVTSITVTFANSISGVYTVNTLSQGVENASLADGRWQLTVPILGYQSASSGTHIYRLFGDSVPTQNVDGSDLAEFGNAFNTSNMAFDFNNDGTVDGLDLTQFGNRFGVSI